MDTLDRAKGALLGLAIGDALGAPLEFTARDEHPLVIDFIGGGPFNLQPGEWTDDSAMALCLADSLIANGELVEADIMARFVRWWRVGENSVNGRCFDIGRTTLRALQRFERTREVFIDPDSRNAGNGCLMRLAPVAIIAGSDWSLAMDFGERQGRITHGAPVAVHACSHFADRLSTALAGGTKRAVFGRRPILCEDNALMEIGIGFWRYKERDEIRSTGFVIDTLEAAIWAVYHSESFEKDALIKAVNLGGDADTVGAVAGQLAGAFYGASGIPDRWLTQLAQRELIEERAVQLVALVKPADEEDQTL